MDNLPDDIPALPAEQYHQIVSPVLQVTTDIAAVRGDPDLYNDMASMLALMTLVKSLADCHLQQQADDSVDLQAIEAAPTGACLMVLNRGELEREQVVDCINALRSASKLLTSEGVLGHEQAPAQKAWQALLDDNRPDAIQQLKSVAVRIVNDIDRWERARDEKEQSELK